MKNWLWLLAAVPYFAAAVSGAEIRQRYAPQTFRIRSELSAELTGAPPAILSLLVPYPETSFYQTVSNIRLSGGKVLPLPDGNGKYVLWVLQNPRRIPPLVRTFTVTVYAVKTDLAKLKNIPQPSGKFPEHTGKSGPFVDPDHPEIRRIAAQLSRNAEDPPAYVRQAFLYVTGHYRYKNPNVGILPLDRILKNGGGDCGNLSSIFISLLRAKGIPARHLVGIRPNGTFHVWAEFYLENAGWIPADVTADLGKNNCAHLGSIRDTCIIVHRGVGFTVKTGTAPQELALLQTYAYWYQGDAVKIRFNFGDGSRQNSKKGSRKKR